MTPRVRSGSSMRSSGYWTVTAFESIVRSVTFIASRIPNAGMRNRAPLALLDLADRLVVDVACSVSHVSTLYSEMPRTFNNPSGISSFHASFWSWSSRSRGIVNRTQMKNTPKATDLARNQTIGGQDRARSSRRGTGA